MTTVAVIQNEIETATIQPTQSVSVTYPDNSGSIRASVIQTPQLTASIVPSPDILITKT